MQIKDHLTLRNLSLQHESQEAFISCKCKAQVSYLIWRLFWAAYHSCWLMGNIVVTSLQDDATVAKWFIYLSNWVYLILTVECVLETLIVVGAWNGKYDTGEGVKLPCYIQVTWLLYTVSVAGAVMVSVWYWTFIHKGRELTAIRFNTHAVSAIYIILNMAVTRLPLRLLHFLYPVALGVIYTMFSAIYYTLGGTNQNGDAYIYSVLDWSKPGRTLVISSLSNFVFIPMVHIFMWALNLIFQKIYDALKLRRVVYNQDLEAVDAQDAMVA